MFHFHCFTSDLCWTNNVNINSNNIAQTNTVSGVIQILNFEFETLLFKNLVFICNSFYYLLFKADI